MKCEQCGKPSNDIVIILKQGPNGFRRYKLCPKCREEKPKHKQAAK